MRLFVTGDTHGAESTWFDTRDGYFTRFGSRYFTEQKNLTKDDYMIICGDFGGIFDADPVSFRESDSETYQLDWLDSKPFTTLFLPGNHENYDRLTGCKDEELLSSWYYSRMSSEEKDKLRKGYPQMKWHGGTVRVIRPSVLMLEHGVFDLNGRKCFVYGGAASHDVSGGIMKLSDYSDRIQYNNAVKRKRREGLPFRVRGISWWQQEIPGPETEEAALTALEKAGWNVDYVFTHDCAASDLKAFGEMMGDRDCSEVNEFLDRIKSKLTFGQWYFGHHHQNIDLPDERIHMIYDRITELP